MDADQLAKEAKALQSLLKLIEDARTTRRLYEDAGMAIPEPLARLLGTQSSNGTAPVAGQPRIIVSPLESPPRPADADDGWIWLPAKSLSPTTLVLGILRGRGDPMPTKELFTRLSEYHDDANYGSMLNIGARLDGEIVERSEGGWILKEPTVAPLLIDGVAWGPVNVFTTHELAEHRRIVLCHILQAQPGGLQIMQIVDQLTGSGLCRSPISKDLIKVDVEVLQREGRIRRVGNSKKWALAPQK